MMSAGSAAILQLLSDYGDRWPPRSDFSDWPQPWRLYMDICDETPSRVQDNKDPQALRDWMDQRLKEVEIEKVMTCVDDHFTKADPKLTGFLTCLAFLKNGYRWAALPVLPEEKDREILTFPENINLPLNKICGLHDMPAFTTYFVLVYGNVVYEGDTPVSMRFNFVGGPTVVESMFKFYRPATLMEADFDQVLHSAAEYLQVTEQARASPTDAGHHFPRRKELMEDIQKTMVQAFKRFRMYKDMTYDNWDHFCVLFGPGSSWFMDGYTTPSGAETLVSHFLDAFLHVPGTSYMYHNKQYQLSKMVAGIRQALDAIRVEDPQEHFDAFTDDVPDPRALWEIRDQILGSVHIFRLAHAHVVGKALLSTAQPVMLGEQTLSAFNEHELKNRAKETAAERIKNHDHNDPEHIN